MAAYKANPTWIRKAIESIEKQLPRPGWEYELRIGVDGCEKTSEILLELGEPHWYSPENVGPYLIRNSLILEAPADAYAPFDCDDVMKRSYLRDVLAWTGTGIAGAGRTTVNGDGRTLRRRSRFSGGVCIISQAAWEKLGGYRPWPMAADHDLIIRAEKLRIRVKRVKEPLYYRRKHPTSLTQSPETKIGSPIRDEFWERAKALTEKGVDLCVTPKTVDLERREP